MDFKSRPVGSALAGGVALLLCFPDFSWSILAWAALFPYLSFLAARPQWPSALAAHGVLAGVYFGGVLYWIPRVLVVHGGFERAAAAGLYLLMVALLCALALPFTLLTRAAAEKGPARALWVAPAAWTLAELLRSRFPVGGFPWALLGASQPPDGYWSQIADLGGVHAVGFQIVAFNAAAVWLLQPKLAKRKRRRAATWVFLFWAASGLYGVYRIHGWTPPEGARLRVALVQPDIQQNGSREDYARAHLETLPKHYAAAAEDGVGWVIFPESPNPFVYGRDFYYTTFWSRLTADHATPLLSPGPAVDPATGRRHNSAFLLAADGQPAYRYDKIHLVPFGEYLPWGRVLGFAGPLVQDVGGFAPGDASPRPGEVAGVRFGTLICYESIFPELARRQVAAGAELLVNVTNDGWFGRTAAPRQHLQLAAWRAVEQRKPLLRAANTGVTVFVDPWGATSLELPPDQPGTLIAEVAANRWRTLYSYWGDGPAALAAALGVAGAALPRRRRRRATQKRKRKSSVRPKT